MAFALSRQHVVGGAPPLCPPLRSRTPAAALDTAAPEPSLRHLPAQSAFNLDSSAPVLGPGPCHPLPRWCGRVTSASTDKGRIYSCRKTMWNVLGSIHASHTSPDKLGGCSLSQERGHTSEPPTPGFLNPGGTHSSPCLFPEDSTGSERESILAIVTQQGGVQSWVQPLHSLFSKQREVESCVLPSPVPSPCLYFIFWSREGGREAVPLSAAPARSSWEGILHPTDLRRHRRIKDGWITANEPACTINTREPSRD